MTGRNLNDTFAEVRSWLHVRLGGKIRSSSAGLQRLLQHIAIIVNIMKKVLFCLFAAAAVLAGCKKDPVKTVEEGKIPISISSSVTKVSGNAFENGDAIGLYVVNATGSEGSWTPGELKASGNHIDNVKYTLSFADAKWTCDGEYYWKDSQTRAEFFCYYPYKAAVGSNVEAVSFTLPTDQSSEAAFKSAEILWGKTGLETPREESVDIATSHRTGQLVVKLLPGAGFTEETLAQSVSGVTVNNLKCGAVLNLKNGSLSATGAVSDIVPLQSGNQYRAFVVPQKIAGQALVTVDVDGQKRSLTATVDFTSNTVKTCTITINKISEGINVSIGGWEEDEIDYGGTLN